MVTVRSTSKIKEIIRRGSVVAHYQPIISVKQRAVIGVEALARGVDPLSGELISPVSLFAQAMEEKVTTQLDRVCRMHAIIDFAPLHTAHPELLLFVNFDASIIDQGVVGSDHLLQLAHQARMAPDNIVIEISESRVKDLRALQRFVERYRNYGFLIAVDDLGAEASNAVVIKSPTGYL